VRAVTRVAVTGNEAAFLNIALHGTAHHVETVVRLYRRAEEAEELSREASQQASRQLLYSFDTDGSVVFEIRMPAESGMQLLKAIARAVEQAPPRAQCSRSRLPLPGLHASFICGRAPYSSLGGWRGNEFDQFGIAVSATSSTGARGRRPYSNPR
jgi:hypothetical protein